MLARLLNRLPKLDWMQVEVTTRCNASCLYCPHGVMPVTGRDMETQVFEKLVPAMARARLVYLQGWGEPLLNPHLPDWVETASRQGCRVGTTTNGTLLTSEMARRLTDAGLDILTISLAGTDDRADKVRKGAPMRRALAAAENIAGCAVSGAPRLNLAYMLLRSRLDELKALPRLAAEMGASRVVVSSLSLVLSPDLIPESRIITSHEEHRRFQELAAELREEAEGLGVSLAFHVVSPFAESAQCSEHVDRSLVVDVGGRVHSCVMTAVPVPHPETDSDSDPGAWNHWFFGEKKTLSGADYGTVSGNGLSEVEGAAKVGGELSTIWHSRPYREFRKTFGRGRVRPWCAWCHKRFIDSFEPVPDYDPTCFKCRYEMIHYLYEQEKARKREL